MKERGFVVGPPIDIATGYDLNVEEGQARAWDLMIGRDPNFTFLAPACTAWSALSNAVPYELRMKKRDAVMPMVDFTVAIATYQHEAGRFFMIENPETSQMWSLPCMKELLNLSGVSYGTAHMCAYGLVDPVSKLSMKKAMRLAHNFPPEVMEEFFQKCTKDHDHQSVVGHCP